MKWAAVLSQDLVDEAPAARATGNASPSLVSRAKRLASTSSFCSRLQNGHLIVPGF
jgi:hypothetical protein